MKKKKSKYRTKNAFTQKKKKKKSKNANAHFSFSPIQTQSYFTPSYQLVLSLTADNVKTFHSTMTER